MPLLVYPRQGIGAARLGDSPRAVREAVGAWEAWPSHRAPYSNPCGFRKPILSPESPFPVIVRLASRAGP